MPLRTDFGSFRQPVDPARNLSSILAGLQGEVNTYERQQLAEQRQADLLKQQALDSARAERALKIREDVAKRAREQDIALGKALGNISNVKTVDKVIPGRVETTNVAGALTPEEQQAIEAGRENLVTKLMELKQQQEVKPTIPISIGGDGSWGDEAVEPTFIQRGTRGSGADPLLQPMYDALGFGEDSEPTFSPKGKGLPTPKPEVAMDEKITQAEKDLSLYDQQAKQALIDIAKSRATTKEVTIPEKVETSEMNKKEWLTRELAKGKEHGLGGQAYATYQDALTKRADQLFGSSKPMTLSDQLKLFKYQQGEKEKALTMKDYETIYPSMKGKINTVDGFKAYDKKVGKNAGSKFNIAEDLYKSMTSKDSGDVDAIYEFLAANNDKLGKMSSDALKTLAAQLKAKYANESGLLDLTDYLGGSAAGDVLGDITLK